MRNSNMIGRISTWGTMVLGVACMLFVTANMMAAQAQQMGMRCQYATDPFCKQMIDQVRACVEYNKGITCKEDINVLLNKLEKNTFVTQQGNDDFRAPFVHAQGCFEHVLSCAQVLGQITQLMGVIHTPMPATPLCTDLNDPLLGQLLDASISQDQDKLLTVRSRSQIVRDYLSKGGKLFVAYPRGGLEKRSSDQQQFYFNALGQYPSSLVDTVLSCDQMDPDMIGATYVFKNQNQWYAFSIKARQAADPQTNSEWALWFGRLNQPLVKDRVLSIHKFLISNNGPDLRSAILSKRTYVKDSETTD